MGRVRHYLADRPGVGLPVGPQVNDSRTASATPRYVHQGVAAVQVGVAAVVYVLGNLAAKLR